jgi:PAS domain S-box-containing protein
MRKRLTFLRLPRLVLVAAFSAIFALTFFAVIFVSGAVRDQINALATANSDSAQWSLAQGDVELLALQTALAVAVADPDDSLGEVRRRFDIFYSRVSTLAESPIFAKLRQEPEVIEALSLVEAHLAEILPLIDNNAATLRSSLGDMSAQVAEIRPEVRKINLKGVNVLSRESDDQRLIIAETLSSVSTLTLLLLVILIVTLALLMHYFQRARDRAEEQSLISSRLAAIVSTALDAVIVADWDGKIIDFNSAAEKTFGFTRDEAIGQPMEDLIVPDYLKDAHRSGMERYRSTGDKRVIGKGRVQLEARRKNGEIFPVELSISTAASEESEIFVSFLRDVSRRVAAKEELIQARDDAVAGERAKTDLIAVMSHEMRTPLNGILGTLELLDSEEFSSKEHAYFDIIRSSGKLLLNHVNAVLEISRAESGEIAISQQNFSLVALVSEMVEGQRSVAEHRGNTLTYSVVTHGEEYAVGDPMRLGQVLLNLIGNAVKFTRNGAITVEVERHLESDLVEFRVSDNGIGINAENHERIFEDFFIVDTSYNRTVGGTGLGLAIVKRLVNAMGGEIRVESEPRQGSLFCLLLTLPAPTGKNAIFSQKNIPKMRSSSRRHIRPLKILVVEDNEINRVVVHDLLEQDGHEIDEAVDGQQGFELATRKSYDLVLMDISMPVLDGIEATRAIRKTEGPGIRMPIVALTAHALPAEVESFRAAGIDEILIKPIDRESLRDLADRYSSGGSIKATSHGNGQPTVSVIDHAHVEELAVAIGQSKIERLVRDFLTELDQAIDEIYNSTEHGRSTVELRKSVHHLAGSSAVLGAVNLRRELAALEERLVEGKQCDDKTEQKLRLLLNQTTRELRLYLRQA